MSYFFKIMNSPVGALKLVVGDDGLAAVLWENEALDRVPLDEQIRDEGHRVLREAERQLREYFEGKREVFDLKLAPAGGTEFQREVWMALRTIPFGETRSYAEIARQVGRPAAVRAVGAANGKNPLSIVVPCHRVIGSSGKLTGFAGGLETKAFLLALEARGELPLGR